MTASAEARETAQLAAQAAADKLATDVSIVDVSDRLVVIIAKPLEQLSSCLHVVAEASKEACFVQPMRRRAIEFFDRMVTSE